MKHILTLSLFSILIASTSLASSEAVKYVVKGAVCTDGSWFNAAESIPVGTVVEVLSADDFKKALKGIDGSIFF